MSVLLVSGFNSRPTKTVLSFQVLVSKHALSLKYQHVVSYSLAFFASGCGFEPFIALGSAA